MNENKEIAPDPKTILRSLHAEAASRREKEETARRIVEERNARLREQAALRAKLKKAFDSVCAFPSEENREGRKPSEEGFQRWSERFLTIGRVLRECDANKEGRCLEDRLRQVAVKVIPQAMKYACAMLLLAAEGNGEGVAYALHQANCDADLSRFIQWLPFILDNLWIPRPEEDGVITTAGSPTYTTQEENLQAEMAFGWRPTDSAGGPSELLPPLPQEVTTEQPRWWRWPLVGERTGRRAASRELARDENRERQSRYCQGFDPDWWLPALLAAKWRSWWYPREATWSSVEQWLKMIDEIRVECLGPFDNPERAAELEAERDSDLALIRQHAPHILEKESMNPPPLTSSSVQHPVEVPPPGKQLLPISTRRQKRSTERGEARTKIISALTTHHKYANGGCLNWEPIGNNELARMADVSESTASAFFEKEFLGHAKYRAMCKESDTLLATLKLLNNEFSPHLLFGRIPPDEGTDTDDE